jgi:hypothetical protein
VRSNSSISSGSSIYLLEGKHEDRCELEFYSMEDVEAKKPAQQIVVEDWLRLVEAMG